MEFLFGILFIIFGYLLLSGIFVLIGDILMIRHQTHISWKESIWCGWLYFIDRMR